MSPILFFAQTSLTGLWIGATSNDSTTVRKDQSFELALTEYKGKVFGYSRTEFIVSDTLYYIVKRVNGTIEGDTCKVTDDEIIAYNFKGKLDKGVKVTSTFIRNSTDNTWRLDGKWKTNATKKYYAVTGKVGLAEEKDLTASKIFPHLEELNLANDIAFYKERTEKPPVVKVVRPEGYKSDYLTKSISSESFTIAPASPDLQQAESFYASSVKHTYEKKSSLTTAPITTGKINISVAQPDLQQTENYYGESVAATKPSSSTGSNVDLSAAHNKPQPVNPNLERSENYYAESVSATGNNKASNISITNSPTTKPTIQKPNLQKAENYPVNATAANKNPTDKQTIKQTEKPVVNEDAYVEDIPTVVKTKTPVVVNSPSSNNKINNTTAVSATLVTTSPAVKVNTPVKTNEEITATANVVSGRKSAFTQEVNFKSDSLVISLYDNGEIDGDTVSVYMNGQMIMAKQGLKSSAIKKTIYITPGNEDFSLVLFADNLGKFPPNTGMLVVYDGDDTYNLRFSSDFNKNAGIVFKRKR